MKYFVAYKKVKLPKYKVYYLMIIFLIILFLIFNLIMYIFINKENSQEFINLFLTNSYGINNNTFNNLDNFLFKYTFGLPILKDKTVIKENNSVENIINDDLEKIVYIYNTFQTDKYQSTYHFSYSMSPYIVQASFILQEYLKQNNIGSIVEEESIVKVLKENNINYSNSYAGSKILLEKRIIETPTLKYYFDIQLSDYKRELTTINIDGINYAKILFVIGTDNPSYEQNQKFALSLNEILTNINDKLSRGISLRGSTGYQGIYNQDFSSNALLIQVGGIYNTIEEVNLSMKVLAEVIATYIKENNYEQK